MTGSPERLIGELVAAAELQRAWFEPSARELAPQLHAAIGQLLSMSAAADGREDLVCVVAGPDLVSTALAPFQVPPFVLVLDRSDGGALGAAEAELLDAFPGLCVNRDARDATLLAPLERILAAPTLPGQWRGAATGTGRSGGEQAIAAPGRSAEHDHGDLVVLAARAQTYARELRGARQALEHAGNQAYIRDAEHQRELAQLERSLAVERAWVAEQADRIAASHAWRIGHRITTITWRLRGRGVRGPELPTIIVNRMRQSEPR